MTPPPVRVLTDSSAGISPELSAKWGVDLVPLYVEWDGRTYRDGIDLVPSDFYGRLSHSPTNPRTAAPNPADFVASCQAALARGCQQVVIVTVTPSISSTYDHACLAAQQFEAGTVRVVNSGQGAGGQALIAAHAARVANDGAALSDVLAAAQQACLHTEVLVAVDSLKYLRRGGRIGPAQAVLGDLVQLKPILTFVDGRLAPIAKPRTSRQATQKLAERLADTGAAIEHVLVMYADTLEPARALADLARRRLPAAEVDLSPVSVVMGGNVGPGLLGIAIRRRAVEPDPHR